MSQPDVSVVMATHNAAGTIGECLESLKKQTFRGEAEIIVADCSTDGTDELIRKRFPGAKVLHFDRPRGVPELIKEAMRHTEGRIVAVTEPHCLFPADWMEKLRRAHESEYSVIGGAVENGRPDGLVSWACYFAGYGGVRFLRAVSSPALPLLLLYRRLRAPFGKGRHRAELLLSVPFLAAFVTAWAAGELVGYLMGPAWPPQQVYQ